jgi:hypothetical protein
MTQTEMVQVPRETIEQTIKRLQEIETELADLKRKLRQ